MTRVDHLVYAVPDVRAAIGRIEERLGVRAAHGGRHPRWGTRNALLGLGPVTYLEILGPDPERPDPDGPIAFGLDRIGEPRLALWAVAAEGLEARVEAAAARGARLGAVSEGSRERPDGGVLSWRLTDPTVQLGDGLVPFLIDWGDSPHPAAAAPAGCVLGGLRGEHPDPERIRGLLEAVGVSLPVSRGPAPALVAAIRSPGGEVELR